MSNPSQIAGPTNFPRYGVEMTHSLYFATWMDVNQHEINLFLSGTRQMGVRCALT